MYFAMLLFWLTAIVMIVVTLTTDNIEEYRVNLIIVFINELYYNLF